MSPHAAGTASNRGVANIEERLFEHTAVRKRLENIDARRTEKSVPVLMATHIAFCMGILGWIHIMPVLVSRHTSATLRRVCLHASRGRHVPRYLTQQGARRFHRLAKRFTRLSRSMSLHAFSPRQWWAYHSSDQLWTFVKFVSDV